MPKNKNIRALTVSAAPATYPIAKTAVTATQLFKVPERHPRGDGTWSDEADKVGWIHPVTRARANSNRAELGRSSP